MHYTKLSVAGCAALMFGLIACSGEDGADGTNGTNGLNGTSCEVKSLKTGDGYKVLCGGDSVGVLLNGKTGATRVTLVRLVKAAPLSRSLTAMTSTAATIKLVS